MKQVVIVSPDFAPSSYPPSIRIRFFGKHLPAFGWQPTILTIEPKYHEWSVDPENERLIPETLEIIRTPALPVRLTRKIGIGDLGIRSLWFHWRALTKLCRERRVDLIFIPVPPYMPMILGRLLYDRFAVPYVIDYIDPWVTKQYWSLPRAQRPLKRTLAYMLSRILEPFALKNVAHIVGVSEGVTDYVIELYPWLTKADATEIPYGGERTDFDYLRRNPRRNEVFDCNDGLLHVGYVGACNPSMYGTVRALLEAVQLGLKRTPGLFARLRLHFVGTTYAPRADGLHQVLPLAREIGVEHLVDEHPNRVPYLDALQILLDSHALLLIGIDKPHYTASRIFPSILARRPLLAVFHEASSVVSILQETHAGQVVTFSSQCPVEEKVQEISKCLEGILSLPRDYQPPTYWEAFERYTARAMTARLAQVFDRVALEEA